MDAFELMEKLRLVSTETEIPVSTLFLVLYGTVVAFAAFVAVSTWILLYGLFAAPVIPREHCHECAVAGQAQRRAMWLACRRWLGRSAAKLAKLRWLRRPQQVTP